MTAENITEVNESRPVYITSVSLGKVSVRIPKHQNGAEVAVVPGEVVCYYEDCFPYHTGAYGNNCDS